MQSDSPLRSLSPHQHALLMEQAKREAQRLRREAITAFWDGVAHALGAALQAGRQRVSALRRTSIAKAAPCQR
jgi:hypothetical protein